MTKIKVFIDAEVASLRGEIFSVAISAINEKNEIIKEKIFTAPRSEYNISDWVRDNVPELGANTNKKDLLQLVAKSLKDDFNVIGNWGSGVYAHFGAPVESGLFDKLFTAGLIGEFDAPIIHEVGTLLELVGEDPTSCDSFIAKNNLYLNDKDENGHVMITHDPRYDNRAAAAVVNHITKTINK